MKERGSNMTSPVRSIVVIDDHPIIHDGLKTLLASEETLSVDGSAASGSEAMHMLEENSFDLAIVDLSLGDSDGTYLIQRITVKFPNLRILVYSMSEERLFAERVAAAGASGYVMKTSDPALLKAAIHAILDGEIFFPPTIKKRILKKRSGKSPAPQSTLDNLSNREIDVFKLIGQGANSATISGQLNITRNTVDTHRINIKKKLDLPSGKALDRMAYEVIIKGKLPKKKA